MTGAFEHPGARNAGRPPQPIEYAPPKNRHLADCRHQKSGHRNNCDGPGAAVMANAVGGDRQAGCADGYPGTPPIRHSLRRVDPAAACGSSPHVGLRACAGARVACLHAMPFALAGRRRWSIPAATSSSSRYVEMIDPFASDDRQVRDPCASSSPPPLSEGPGRAIDFSKSLDCSPLSSRSWIRRSKWPSNASAFYLWVLRCHTLSH